MAHLKKKTVKFCPLCAAPCVPRPKGPGSTCSQCGLVFSVLVPDPEMPRYPKVGGHTHKSECIGQNGKSKLCHSSVAEAYARALAFEDIPHRNRKDMEFYQCRWCEKIHMGHGGKGRKAALKSYTNKEAKALYEEAIENGELLPYPEDWHEKIQK